MKTKEQIIEWLKSNGLYEAFAKNISPETVEVMVEKYCSRTRAIGIFDFALTWVKTKEGFEFWGNANDKFLQWFNSDEQADQSADRWVFDGGIREAPFYMVHVEGRPTRPRKYSLMKQATKAADRLAKSLNTTAYVLAAVMELRPEVITSAVGIDDMAQQDDDMF